MMKVLEIAGTGTACVVVLHKVFIDQQELQI
jgi:hypothetical protein